MNVWSDIGHEPVVTSPQCRTDTIGDIVSWREFAELDGDFVQTRSKCDGKVPDIRFFIDVMVK